MRQKPDIRVGHVLQRSASTGSISSGSRSGCRTAEQSAFSLDRKKPTPTRIKARCVDGLLGSHSGCPSQHGDPLSRDANRAHEFWPPRVDRDVSVATVLSAPDTSCQAPLPRARPAPPQWEPVALGPCLPLAATQRPSTPPVMPRAASLTSLARVKPPPSLQHGFSSRPTSATLDGREGNSTPSHAARLLLGSTGSAVVGSPTLPKPAVKFVATPNNSFRVITPYSKVYGQHPSFFDFNRRGEMQLTDLGVADELRQETEAIKFDCL